jgi:hypothetical protein
MWIPLQFDRIGKGAASEAIDASIREPQIFRFDIVCFLAAFRGETSFVHFGVDSWRELLRSSLCGVPFLGAPWCSYIGFSEEDLNSRSLGF